MFQLSRCQECGDEHLVLVRCSAAGTSENPRCKKEVCGGCAAKHGALLGYHHFPGVAVPTAR